MYVQAENNGHGQGRSTRHINAFRCSFGDWAGLIYFSSAAISRALAGRALVMVQPFLEIV